MLEHALVVDALSESHSKSRKELKSTGTCSNAIRSDAHSNVSFTELLQRIDSLLDSDEASVEDMEALLNSYVSKRSDWKKYAYFDPCRYTRNLVLPGTEKFNLLLLCWGEGQASGIHDHANSDCFVKVLDGEVEETRYDWPTEQGGPMLPTSTGRGKTNDVLYMNDRIGLHRLANASHSKSAVTLHLYSPPFVECGCYCERTSKRNTSRMTFTSKAGKRDDSCAEIRKKMGLKTAS